MGDCWQCKRKWGRSLFVLEEVSKVIQKAGDLQALPKITSIDFFPPCLHFKTFPCSTYSTAWMCTSRFLGKSVHPGMKTGRRRLLQSERLSGWTGNFSSVRPLLMWVKTKWLSLSSFIECYQKLSQRWQAVIDICSSNRQGCTIAWWGNCKWWSSVT